MAKNIDEGFRKFHGMLLPTHEESQAAKSHRASIEACLKKNFGMTRLFRTGSFGNGTSIRGYSDVDYFACIPTEHLKPHSFTTLQDVHTKLRSNVMQFALAGSQRCCTMECKLVSEGPQCLFSDEKNLPEGTRCSGALWR